MPLELFQDRKNTVVLAAHKDVAFAFASWVSLGFKLYIIKDYQRLKEDGNSHLSLDWNLNSAISKINYRIHTMPLRKISYPTMQRDITYANEADVLNVAFFGCTAKEGKEKNGDKKGNIRDYATSQHLIASPNMESMNAELIKKELPQNERLQPLNQMAIEQLTLLFRDESSTKTLKKHNITKLLTVDKDK